MIGRSSVADKRIVLDAGATDYLIKAFDPDELFAVVETMLDNVEQRKKAN